MTDTYDQRMPQAIAAAWRAWHARHGGKLGPGPAFDEAIRAALAALFTDTAPAPAISGGEMVSVLRDIERESTAAIAYEAEGKGSPDDIPNGLRTVAHIKLSMIREKSRAALAAADRGGAAPAPQQGKKRNTVNDEREILERLASGDQIVYSQDGDAAWFSQGDRAFVSDAVIALRRKALIVRQCDDDENYRGLSEYDTISEAGRAFLAAPPPDKERAQ